jgi:hypothetical protein
LPSTSKPFLAIFTISSYQVISCFESTIKLIICCCLHHIDWPSFNSETIPYASIYVSYIINAW